MHSPIFSLEVFPPKRTSPVGTIYDTLDGLQGLDPDFISVTYGTGKSSDRTLTARIAHTVNEYGIPAVAHLTAQYLDKDDVDEALDLCDQAKVSGVLALRGDRVEGAEPAGVFDHASDLAAYIREKRPNLKIYGACYPEKHPQAATLEEDIDNLKKKVDAGVSHLISQLFYDNEDFLRFVDKARAAGIDVPIEAGIMPVTNRKQIERMVTASGPTSNHSSSDSGRCNKHERDGFRQLSETIPFAILTDINDYYGNHGFFYASVWGARSDSGRIAGSGHGTHAA